MLYSAQRAMARLHPDERAGRLTALNVQLQAGYVARNAGRRLTVRAGYVLPSLECVNLEGATLASVELRLDRHGRAYFDVVTTSPQHGEYHSKVTDLADLLYE